MSLFQLSNTQELCYLYTRFKTVGWRRIESERFLTMEKNGSNTKDSQTVTHSSTNLARRCFTAVFGREPVFSTWYGRYRQHCSSLNRVILQLEC